MDDVGAGAYPGCVVPAPPQRFLEVRADGRMQAESKGDCGGPYEGVYSKDDLQALLRYLVDDLQFMQLTTSEIWDEIQTERKKRNAQTGLGRVADAGNTVVHVKAADRENEVTFNAPAAFAKENPGAKKIAQFAYIVAQLRDVGNILIGEGKRTVDVAVRKANDYLAKTRPDLPQVRVFDRVRSFVSDDGEWSSEFLRKLQEGTTTHVTVANTLSEQATVAVDIRPAR